LADSIILEWRGRTYTRSDLPPSSPHHGSPAHPYEIPIKGDFDSNSGDLGIVKVAVINEVERVILFPQRGGVYDRRNGILPRPYYFERDATGKRHKAFKVFCAHCGDYQRREAFYPDPTRPNGLRPICKTCISILNHEDYLKRKERAQRMSKIHVQAA